MTIDVADILAAHQFGPTVGDWRPLFIAIAGGSGSGKTTIAQSVVDLVGRDSVVYLQQDAFDRVDASMSRERQVESLYFLKGLIDSDYDFTERNLAREFFTQLTSLYKNWNYSEPDSQAYQRYRDELSALAAQHRTSGQAL